MKRVFYFMLWLGIGVFPYAANADNVQMGMITGGEAGTYYRFGQDMKKLSAQNGIDLTVYPSRGSVENILAIYDSRSIQLGIAQSDVLLFAKLLGDDKVKEIAREIKVVFPLYDEEIHLLATSDIRRFSDLQGKKVAIGRDGSGTAMTTSVLFEVTKVKPAEALELGGPEAVEALRRGKIDAMFFVAGYPVALFRDNVSKNDKFHLVPIAEKAVIELFGTSSTIPAAAYAWQDKDVATVTVKAGLMTLDYKSDNLNCTHVGRFAKMIRDNLDWLQKNGHEKWKNVDFKASEVSERLQSACASP